MDDSSVSASRRWVLRSTVALVGVAVVVGVVAPNRFVLVLVPVTLFVAVAAPRFVVAFGFLAVGVAVVLEWLVLEGSDPTIRVVVVAFTAAYAMGIARLWRTMVERDALSIRAAHLSEIGRVAGLFAHQVANYASIVRWQVDRLGREPSGVDDETATTLESIAVAAGTLTSLSRHFSQAAGAGGNAVACDPAAVARSVVDLVRGLYGPEVRIELDVDDPPSVAVAPYLLEQVVLNLVVNACESLDATGAVRVTTGHTVCARDGAGGSTWARIAVADTGCGIPPDLLGAIFRPYVTTKAEGTGVGLVLVRSVVEGAGGVVEVTSALGVGTTFIVLLPADDTGAPR